MENHAFTLAQLRSRRGAKWHRYQDDVIPCWVAEMDFPVAQPIQAVMERLVREQDTDIRCETVIARN